MAVYINTLIGGDITIGTGGGSSEHPETRFTLQDGTVETANITGTLDPGWMIDNGYLNEDITWLKPITQADIGNTVTRIDENAFDYCTTLTSVMIPNSVTIIENDAFRGCSGLTSVTFQGKTLAQVQAMARYPWGISDTSIINVA